MINIFRNKLIDQLKQNSLKRGQEFTLSSGQKSNIYIDVKKTMLLAKMHHIISALLINEAKKFSPYQIVAGVALGGCHLASIVGMASQTDVLYIRKNIKDHGTQNLVECPDSSEKEVLLIEDVVTTGKSVIKAADILSNQGYVVQGIVSVVDRRPIKTDNLSNYRFAALIDFEELIENE